MQVYKKLVRGVMAEGERVEGRNGMTLNSFGKQLELSPLSQGFPILTSRKIFYKGVLGEMAAFLAGPQHITDFRKHGCNYWDAWGDENGAINVDYGNLWQNFDGMNQLKAIHTELLKNPYSRRNVLTGWNPKNLEALSLPCCHYAYQFMVTNGALDIIWIQRSVDVMIGLPSDMVAAAVFLVLMAQTAKLIPGRIIMQLGSTHIYEQHLAKVDAYLERPEYPLPEWSLAPEATIYNFEPRMLEIYNYAHEDPIKFDLVI